MYDLIIKNGMVVSPESTIQTDVGIKEDKIVTVGNLKNEEASRVIDAKDKYVMPGAIEAHMHCQAPFQGALGANTFYEQSVSAAFGGITTFMDFANTFKGDSPVDAAKERIEEMGESAIDYGVHGKFVEMPGENDIKELIEDLGIPTYKMFMTYKKDGVMSDNRTMLEVFQQSKDLSGLPMVHCESNAIAERNDEIFEKNDELTWENFAKSKPKICETEAFSRAVKFAEHIGNALLIVHTTNKEALNIARRAHKKDVPLYVETGTHYLTLFDDQYKKENGHLAICSPPLRTPEDAEDLWDGLQDGTICLTGSDDCTFDIDEKSMFLEKDENGNWIQDYTKVVNGLSGIEIRLPILLSEGVSKNRLSINKVCALTSSNIAKVYGCYPQKGIIAPGSDADITIVDMNKEVTLSKDMLHNNISYCLHDGFEIKGYPIMTIANGKVIVENGEFKGKKGEGRFIKRKTDPQYLEKYAFNY